MFSGCDKDATFVPTLASGQDSPVDSQIIILPQGGVFVGALLGTLEGWSPTHYFFLGQLALGRGGARSLP